MASADYYGYVREPRGGAGIRVVMRWPTSFRRTARTLGSTGSYGDSAGVTGNRLPAPGLEPSILPPEGQSEFVAEAAWGCWLCESTGERDRVSLLLRVPPG